MENNECILSKIDKATIKEIVGNRDLNIICKDGKRLDEIKIFVTESINGKVKCSKFLDELWEQTGHGKPTFDAPLEEKQWTGCAIIQMLKCQNKKIPENIPSWAFGCPIKI